MSLTIYKASAGSGKTYTLVKEYIQMLYADGDTTAYRRILAVTFTHKATNEMKQRIILQLYALAKGDKSPYRHDLMQMFKLTEQGVNEKARQLLFSILQDYSSFSISTIDSFFQRIIRSFAKEVGLSGSYSVGLDTDILLQQAIDTMFAELDNNSPLFKWLVQYTIDNIQEGKSWKIKGNIETLGKQLFTEHYLCNHTDQKKLNKQQLTDFKTSLYAYKTSCETKLKEIATKFIHVLNSAELQITDFKNGKNSPIKCFRDWQKGCISQPKETFYPFTESSQNCYAKSAPADTKQRIDNVYPQLQPLLKEAWEWWQNNSKDYNTRITLLQHINTLGILGDLDANIRKLTQEQNILPITDTNLLLNKIIADSDTPFIYEKIGTRYNHYMLDEFQDTSVMQWDNFKPLIEESLAKGNNNLIVGDVKQSIYRWRNSDWTLLSDKIYNDIKSIKDYNLPNNYRSGKNIIQFNNTFFNEVLMFIKTTLQQEHAPTGFELALDKAYETILQTPGKNMEEKGCVEIIRQNEGDTQAYKEWALDNTINYVKTLQERGVALHDITILVRYNADAQILTSTLLKQGYPVVSNEGLCVNNAISVRFLLNLLKLQVVPEDNIHYAITNYYYLRTKGKGTDEAIQKATQHKNNLLFTEEEKSKYLEINSLSLCDKVQQFIGLFQLGEIAGEKMFLQSFLDFIFQYVNENNADQQGFIEWWESVGNSKTIPCPTMKNAITVMTIHQSKGLEFPYVIIPFVWDISVKRDIVWCHYPWETDEIRPEFIPISLKKDLQKTHFDQVYFKENINVLIDNLNLLYVAFTRAEKGLFCMIPFKKEDKLNNTAGWINTYIKKHTENIKQDNPCLLYQEGEIHQHPSADDEYEEQPKTNLEFQYTEIKDRLKIKDTFIPHQLNQSLQNDRRRMGIIMHDILKNINYEEDFQKAIKIAIYEGKITQDEVGLVENELQKFKDLVNGRDWFNKQYIIHNEASILLPNGLTKRPDRLMINPQEKNAIVVDYKFGDKMEDKYINQVKEYQQYITAMGYQCQAYICYIEIGKIITA